MSRQPVIKIQATILIPYDPKKFGDTGRAETIATALEERINGDTFLVVDKWEAFPTTVTVEK